MHKTTSPRSCTNGKCRFLVPVMLGVLGLAGCGGGESPQHAASSNEVNAPSRTIRPEGNDAYTEALKRLEKGGFSAAIAGFSQVIEANSNHAKALYHRGTAYEQKGDLSSALTDYTRAIDLEQRILETQDPSDGQLAAPYEEAVALGSDLASVYIRRGEIHRRQGAAYERQDDLDRAHGEYDLAIHDFTQAIRLGTNHAEAYCSRGAVFLRKGMVTVAIADLTEASGLDPASAEAFCQRGRAYMASDDYCRAIEDCGQAVRLDPTYAAAYAVLGSAHFARGDFAESASCFEEAIRRDSKMAAQIHPNLAHAWYKWSKVLQKAGRQAEAQRLADKARTLVDEGGQPYVRKLREEPTRASQREDLFNRGLAHLEKRKFHLAVDRFTEAIDMDGRCARAYCRRGQAFVEKGFPDTAIEDLDQAIRLDLDCAEAYCQRCRAHGMLFDFHRALKDGTHAIQLRPEYAQAYIYRGVAYLGQRDFGRAIADLSEAIRLEPESAQAYANRGLVYLRKGNLDQAITDLNEAIQMEPESAEARANRGLAHLKKGNLNRAIADLDEAIQREPRYAPAYAHRGLVHLEKYHLDEAIVDLTEAIRLDQRLSQQVRPGLAEAYRRRAIVRERDGRHTEARADFERAQKFRPDSA